MDLPTNFGKQDVKSSYEKRLLECERVSQQDGNPDSDSESEDSLLPLSHIYTLKGHKHPISSIVSSAEWFACSAKDTVKLYKYDEMHYNINEASCEFLPFFDEDTRDNEFGFIKQTQETIAKMILYKKVQMAIILENSPSFRIVDDAGSTVWESTKGDVYIHDLYQTRGHVKKINDIAVDDSGVIITCSEDGTVRFWKYGSQKGLVVVKAPLRQLFLSKRQLFVIDRAGLVYKIDSDAKTGSKSKPQRLTGQLDGATVIESNPFTGHLITWFENGRLAVWDLMHNSLSLIKETTISRPAQYNNLTISSDGHAVIVATSGNSLLLVDLAFDKEPVTVPLPFEPTTVFFNRSTNQILVGGTRGQVAHLFHRYNSVGGVKIVLTKPPKRKFDEAEASINIENFSEDKKARHF